MLCEVGEPMYSTSKESNDAAHPSYINYVQPVTQQYESRTVRKSTSIIKKATMKNMDNFHYAKEAITCYHQKNTSLLVKMNGTQKRKLVSP